MKKGLIATLLLISFLTNWHTVLAESTLDTLGYECVSIKLNDGNPIVKDFGNNNKINVEVIYNVKDSASSKGIKFSWNLGGVGFNSSSLIITTDNSVVYNGATQYKFTGQITIDQTGSSVYTLETNEFATDTRDVKSALSGKGCPFLDGNENQVAFQIAQSTIIPAVINDQICTSVGSPLGYYSCVFDTSTQNADMSELEKCDVSEAIRNQAAADCSSQLDSAQGAIGRNSCIKCPSNETTIKTIVGHLKDCSDTTKTKCVSGLRCIDSVANDPVTKRCVYTTETLGLGKECYLGAKEECNGSKDFTNFCKSDPKKPYLGVCANFTDEDDCRLVANPNSFCNNITTDFVCSSNGRCAAKQIEPVPNDGNTSGAGPLNNGESTQFGARNCPTGSESVACKVCINQKNTWVSGIGCISTSPEGIFLSIIRIMLGVMGGIALIRLIILGFQYQGTTSDAELKKAREAVLSTLAAIVIALFSVLILQFIGVNVLDVVAPGFFTGG